MHVAAYTGAPTPTVGSVAGTRAQVMAAIALTGARCLQYAGTPSSEFATINVDVIYPCTPKHISKYSQQMSALLCETPEMYAAVTEPHIAATPASATAWVFNILDKKKEADRMIFEDPDPETGFMLHPDLKWDATQACTRPPPACPAMRWPHKP